MKSQGKKLAGAPAAVCEVHAANWASFKAPRQAIDDQCREFRRIKVPDRPHGRLVSPSPVSLFDEEKS